MRVWHRTSVANRRLAEGGFSRFVYAHKKQIRLGGFIALGVAVFCILAQLAYPTGRLLPHVRVGSRVLGATTVQKAESTVSTAFAHANVQLHLGKTQPSSSLAAAGITVDGHASVITAARYSFWQRLIPFSSVGIMLHRDTPLTVRFDNDRVTYFAQQASAQASTPAKDASIVLSGTTPKLVPAVPSITYETSALVAAIHAAKFDEHTVVTVAPKHKNAELSSAAASSALTDAQHVLGTKLTLKIGGGNVVVPAQTIAGWLTFPENKTTRKLELTVSADAVKTYLNTVQGKVYKAPGTATVTLVDGQETARTTGADGMGLDLDASTQLITKTLTNSSTDHDITLPTTTLPAAVKYDRQYSSTAQGLSALLQYLSSTNGFGLAVTELSGSGRSASANGAKQFEAASTYKLFVAYSVLSRIESGAIQWTDTVNNESVASCFDAMIVVSDNNCAVALTSKVGGWNTVDNDAWGLGISHGTNLGGATKYTTANDLDLILQKYQQGTVLNDTDRARLINDMKRQIYRQGIPAGTGQTVADKVGFVDNVIHDAGIVYGPNGPYVMVVMTSNSSWSSIASAAQQINQYLTK